ncbi:MAG TPA: hypothetical protein VK729_06800 [Silvibacterium sp.]|nr:hypothetical protein [Silvibacterium sp.]
MRDDAMKDRDDLDILLDAALATYADPGLSPGLTSRIVASAHGIDSRRRPVRWLPWAVLALAALVLIVAFFTLHNLTHRTALPPVAQLSPRPSVHVLTTPDPAISIQPTVVRSNSPRTVKTLYVANPQQPLPRLEVFPTPTPLTSEEQALVALANRNLGDNTQPFARNQTQPVEPLRIAVIQIPPLNPPDNGGN